MTGPARHIADDHVAGYADVLAAPPHMIAEVTHGELHVQPRPALLHALVTSRLGQLLAPFDGKRRQPGGWWIVDEPELHLGAPPDILVPDLAGWRHARMPEIAEVAFLTLAPDWVCEVLSPSTQRFDRAEKLEIYRREAVGHAWIIDPAARLLEAYALEHHRWVRVAVHHGDTVVAVDPFVAVAIDLSLLWER